ncbi:MAG: adenylosuccinate synthase [Ruminococcus sp.]|uniref:adenylosuccinate synthase n=1 Tax=Ruminococcus sp. TaxID=41978 RepID=UPI0025F7CC46|nr:adenylosuccinate synthase [Ruminococcus sp.]MCR5539480.1 adenylosuccinate synthase [Ruminococcus sp.]
MVRAIVGANWGDEGKGKLTDMMAQESDIVIRFQGGANAGHTIHNHYGRFALHTLPSGIFYDHTTNIIGNGVAFDIPKFFKELNEVTSQGVPMPKLLISDRVQMIMPYHIDFDKFEEERLGKASFGSTKSGIAPFYSDKYAKIGFQVQELFDEEALKEKIHRVLEQKNILLKYMYNKPAIDENELFNTLMEYKKMVEPYVCDVSAYLWNAIKEGKNILLEGQLGSLKDPDHGIYPMVTSSSTLAAYGAIGAGIPPYEIKKIVTVCKAYSSAVGAGAFVSEIFGDEAEELRKRGGDKGEYGATTGRPRRMGWFDCVASKYGCRIQGTTDVAFTVVDALGYLDKIPVCVGYEIDGKVTTDFPTTGKLEKAKPVLEVLDGWKSDIGGIRKYEDLPENCRKYIEFVEKQIGFPITMVSNGPKREDIIMRESKLSK